MANAEHLEVPSGVAGGRAAEPASESGRYIGQEPGNGKAFFRG